MDYFNAYNYNESGSYEAIRSAIDVGFYDEGGSAVPLPEELTKMFKPLECELCGVIVTSEVTAYTHYEGKVHMKNVNAYMKEHYNIFGSMRKTKPEFTPHQCEVCKCELSSLIQAQQHYSGKVHKKNLRKINYDLQTAIALQPPQINDDLGPDLLKDLPPPPPPPVLSDFICEICNVTTNTEYQLIVHKNGTKHKKKVKKLKESFGNCGTDGFGYYMGEIPTHNFGVEQLTFSTPEPIVTEYLPLSNEPLHFNSSQSNSCAQYDVNIDNDDNEENIQSSALCIRWFNDKTGALPKRPLEDAWVETFKKKTEDALMPTFPSHAMQVSASQISHIPKEQSEDIGQTICNADQMTSGSSYSDIRTSEAPPEVANLPQFSVAAVLPQLQAPPSPPLTLMTNVFLGGPLNGTTPPESTLTVAEFSNLDPPKIHFREPQQKIMNESPGILLRESTEGENGAKEQEIKKTESTSSAYINEAEQGEQSKTNKENSSKFPIGTEIQINSEQRKGKFITNNWENSLETNTDNENNQKKKKLVNFLFGFKKELDKKRSLDSGNNLQEENVHEAFLIKETETRRQQDLISCKSDNAAQSKETNGSKVDIVSDKTLISKKCETLKEKSSDLKEGEISKRHSEKKTEESKYYKDEVLIKHQKDRNDNSLDYERSDYSYHKHKGYKKYKDDYDKGYKRPKDDYDKEYKKSKKDYDEEHKKYKDDYDKDYKKKQKNDYDKDHKKYRNDYDKDYKKHKDDYERYSDSDEDYWHEKRKHKYSSREEKNSHKNHSDRKPSLAQPFVHKTSTKDSILNYLAPPSNFDSKDIAMYRTPSGLYYCTICDYKSKHSSEFTNHLYSKVHKDNKKKKTK